MDASEHLPGGNNQIITVVSGLPRSGTSLMMQMLSAGGLPLLTDNVRAPDEDNPRGYFEFERVKQIKRDKAWLADAGGKAVKIIHLLLYELPPDQIYRVIFMRRNIDEVLASQQKMLRRSGRQPAVNEDALKKIFESQIVQVTEWLTKQSNFRLMEVWHHELMARPVEEAAKINMFLGGFLHEATMINMIEPSLHRNR